MNTAHKLDTRPQIEALTITPAMASQWLKSNTHNRPARKAHVARLANEMVKGNWQLNGETIKFDTWGRLVDGQHRLMAIIEASQPITMHVCTGLAADSDVFATIDVGLNRSAGSVLAMHGIKYATEIAAGIAFMKQTFGNSTSTQKASNAETLQTYLANPEKWQKIASIASYNEIREIVRKPVFSVWLWDALDVSEPQALDFVEMFRTGANLEINHPVLTLRRSLTAKTENVNNAKFRFDQYYRLCIAWNAWRDGRTLQRIPTKNLPINTRIKLH
jgi:hypothetical protein